MSDPNARLAALAERLRKIDDLIVFCEEDDNYLNAASKNGPAFALKIYRGVVEFDGPLDESTWPILNLVRAWQSGPASDPGRTELTPKLRIAMRFATVLIRDVLSDHSEESTERLSEISHYVEDTGEWDDELGWSDLADVLEAALAAETEPR